jgi:serine/threonine-protein kinase
MSMTLRFPAAHPVPDVLPLEALPPAPAPTLMPGPLPPAPPPPPAPDRQGRKAAAVLGAVAAVVVATVTLVATTQTDEPAGVPVGDPGSNLAASAEDITTTTADPVPLDENSALQLLENQVANDRAQVESLTELWVPQLSSKQFGLVVNGTTYDYRAIWSDFTSMQARHPGALLLWSGDYTSFRLADFWVTIAPDSFGSGEAANDWCASEGIGKDDCYAKRLTHTGGFAENTLLRN